MYVYVWTWYEHKLYLKFSWVHLRTFLEPWWWRKMDGETPHHKISIRHDIRNQMTLNCLNIVWGAASYCLLSTVKSIYELHIYPILTSLSPVYWQDVSFPNITFAIAAMLELWRTNKILHYVLVKPDTRTAAGAAILHF